MYKTKKNKTSKKTSVAGTTDGLIVAKIIKGVIKPHFLR